MILGKSEAQTRQNNYYQIIWKCLPFKKRGGAQIEWGIESKVCRWTTWKSGANLAERKRLDILEDLKEAGGPFTSSEEVKYFLNGPLRGNLKKRYSEKNSNLQGKAPLPCPIDIRSSKYQPLFRQNKNTRELRESMRTYLGNYFWN